MRDKRAYHAARAHLENGGFLFTAWFVREVNCRFLVNEHGDLSIFLFFFESSKRLLSIQLI